MIFRLDLSMIQAWFKAAALGMGEPSRLGGYARLKLSLSLSCLTSFTVPKASSTDHHWRKEQAYGPLAQQSNTYSRYLLQSFVKV